MTAFNSSRPIFSLVRDTDRLAGDITARYGSLHYLVLCAGVVRGRRLVTPEGVESNFAINYLSQFVLTGRLLPLLQSTGAPGAAARIVVIGGAAMNGKIHYDDINLTRNFGILTMVPQFCQANDLFVIEQARRLAESRDPPRVTVTTLKVGVVRTNIRRDFPGWMKVMVTLVFDPLLGQTPEQIAEPAMRLLVSPEFEGKSGVLFTQIKRFKPAEPGARTRDPREGQRFWEFSERLAAQTRTPGRPPTQGKTEAAASPLSAAATFVSTRTPALPSAAKIDAFLVCTHCQKPYSPVVRAPKAGQRNFCPDCRREGVPSTYALKDFRLRQRQSQLGQEGKIVH